MLPCPPWLQQKRQTDFEYEGRILATQYFSLSESTRLSSPAPRFLFSQFFLACKTRNVCPECLEVEGWLGIIPISDITPIAGVKKKSFFFPLKREAARTLFFKTLLWKIIVQVLAEQWLE